MQRPRPHLLRGAFTLIEVLVAAALMALILVFLLQITSLTTQTVSRSSKQIDASRKNRLTLDVLEQDMANAVLTHGATILVRAAAGSPGNDELAFVVASRLPEGAPADANRFLAVCYSLDANHRLIRAYVPVPWGERDLAGAALAATAPGITSSVIAAGIVRFEVMVGLDDGRLVPLADAPGEVVSDFKSLSLGPAPATPTPPPATVNRLLVAVASLDGQTLEIADVARVARGLAPAGEGETPMDVWNQALAAGLDAPAPVQATLRFFQRTYPIR